MVDTESPRRCGLSRSCRIQQGLRSSARALRCDDVRGRSSAHANFAGSSTSAASPRAASSDPHRRSRIICAPRQVLYLHFIANLSLRIERPAVHVRLVRAREFSRTARPCSRSTAFRNQRECVVKTSHGCPPDNARRALASEYSQTRMRCVQHVGNLTSLVVIKHAKTGLKRGAAIRSNSTMAIGKALLISWRNYSVWGWLQQTQHQSSDPGRR